MYRTGALLDRQFLALATNSLAAGDTRMCRQYSNTVLVRSKRRRNTSGLGAALLTLAQADVLDSNLESAYAMSASAVRHFERDQDQARLADALSMVAYSASALGKSDAFELAERAALLRCTADDAEQVSALNYMGVAALWGQDFQTADGAFEAASWYAVSGDWHCGVFQPAVNRCFTEALRIFRLPEPAEADLTQLFRLLTRAWCLRNDGRLATVSPSTHLRGLLALLDLSSCFAQARAGNLEQANNHAIDCQANVEALPTKSWIRSLAWWARCEVAWMRHDALLAQLCAQAVVQTARIGEHERMVELGRWLGGDTG